MLDKTINCNAHTYIYMYMHLRLQEEYTPKFVTSLAFSHQGDVIAGDSNGRILVWTRDQSDAFVLNKRLSEPMSHAHPVRAVIIHTVQSSSQS